MGKIEPGDQVVFQFNNEYLIGRFEEVSNIGLYIIREGGNRFHCNPDYVWNADDYFGEDNDVQD